MPRTPKEYAPYTYDVRGIHVPGIKHTSNVYRLVYWAMTAGKLSFQPQESTLSRLEPIAFSARTLSLLTQNSTLSRLEPIAFSGGKAEDERKENKKGTRPRSHP